MHGRTNARHLQSAEPRRRSGPRVRKEKLPLNMGRGGLHNLTEKTNLSHTLKVMALVYKTQGADRRPN